MPPDESRAGPRHMEPARHDQRPDQATESGTTVAPVVELAAYRELRSWAAAAEWLNVRGLPAAVPEPVVSVLRRHGLTVWPCAPRTVA